MFAAVPYTIEIWRGYRPSYATWIVWFVVGATAFIFHLQTGAEDSIWLPLMYAIVPFWYLGLLWFLDAKWQADRLEYICLMGAGLSWLVWVLSHMFGGVIVGETLPLLAIVIVDSVGSVPTIRRAWFGLENDNGFSWLLTGVATASELFAVDNWYSAEAIYPTYLAIAMGLIALFSNTRSVSGRTERSKIQFNHPFPHPKILHDVKQQVRYLQPAVISGCSRVANLPDIGK